ncbi:phosphotransacetylase family protein [Spirulina subsalsa]|uniref:phosphotransacetylase family protein n=1 Tax=Spirulina subsalsa TaxID=54311 RepID=UPI0004750AB4|nr:phosphotransacetylase family protein [Spirulina subsalsa]
MPKSRYLLVGSTEPYSGKSATILGLAHQLRAQGLSIGYGKPLSHGGEEMNEAGEDEDVQFIRQILNLTEQQTQVPLLFLDEPTVKKGLHHEAGSYYVEQLQSSLAQVEGDLVLLEGLGTISEGRLFNLSLKDIAAHSQAMVLIVARYHSLLLVDQLLDAQDQLGDRLFGVVINDIPPQEQEAVKQHLQPFLENQGIPVLGMMPRSSLLRSVSVRELTKQLGAKVLCRSDRLDLMVERLTIGAMNVNSALEYFRKGENMAVVTGGDRSELQMAALETSTNCLILTGHTPPQDFIINRAEDLEIPILSVDLDTLSTVEIVDRTFGQVRLQESIKVHCIRELMAEYFDLPRFMQLLQ